jgi:hypothetical protein
MLLPLAWIDGVSILVRCLSQVIRRAADNRSG